MPATTPSDSLPVTPRVSAAGRDAWERMLIGWHVAFWLMVSVAAVFTLVSSGLDRTARWQAGGLLAVLGVSYLVGVMRDRVAACGPVGWTHLAVAVVVVGLACSVDPVYATLLFVVFPQIWMFTPSLGWGTAGCVALTVSVIIGIGTGVDWTEDVIRDVVPQLAISLLFTVLLGFWISRVIDQSRQRAELIEQLQRTQDELAAAHHAHGVLAERERMAREIHDTLAQGFISIVTLAQAVQARWAKSLAQDASPNADQLRRELDRLATIEAVARESLAEARALVAAFSPIDLDGVALPEAVTRLGERFAERTGTRVEVEVAGSLAGLGRDAEVVLLRAVQEALANVRRHARARSVVIRLVTDAQDVRVEVTDDGVGFATSQPEGFGLAGMRDRVGEVGGQVEVDSEVGTGTRVVVHVPATEREAAT